MYTYLYMYTYIYIYMLGECVICPANVYMYIYTCTNVSFTHSPTIYKNFVDGRRVCEGSIDETLAKQNVCAMMRVIHMCTYIFANRCKTCICTFYLF